MEKDAHLFLQIRNFVDYEIVSLINNYKFVKELMNYLNFLFPSKENFSQTFNVHKGFYRLKEGEQFLMTILWTIKDL